MSNREEIIRDIICVVGTIGCLVLGIFFLYKTGAFGDGIKEIKSVILNEEPSDTGKDVEDNAMENPSGYYLQIPEDMELLKQYKDYNEDVVGYIRIRDTVLDHPLMQTPNDEEFYLYRDLDKKYNSHGVPFLSARSKIESYGDNMVIYGHNIHKNTSDVFCVLAEYESVEFYKNHPIVETISDSGTRRWLIFAYYIVDNSDTNPFMYSETTTFNSMEGFKDYMTNVSIRNWLKTDIPCTIDDSYITLSSCSRELSGTGTHSNRMVVMGKLLENNEDYTAYVEKAERKDSPLMPEKLR